MIHYSIIRISSKHCCRKLKFTDYKQVKKVPVFIPLLKCINADSNRHKITIFRVRASITT